MASVVERQLVAATCPFQKGSLVSLTKERASDPKKAAQASCRLLWCKPVAVSSWEFGHHS